MKKIYCWLFTFSFFGSIAQAQNVGIGTNAPKASAVLDIMSSNKGVLFPRMTTSERNAIINPANGLHIYNTNSRLYCSIRIQ